jgi:hypothetical protein
LRINSDPLLYKKNQNNTKRPQTLQKDLENENKGQIVIIGVFFVFFLGKNREKFLYFLGGVLYYLGGFLYFFRGKKVGEFLYFFGGIFVFS